MPRRHKRRLPLRKKTSSPRHSPQRKRTKAGKREGRRGVTSGKIVVHRNKLGRFSKRGKRVVIKIKRNVFSLYTPVKRPPKIEFEKGFELCDAAQRRAFGRAAEQLRDEETEKARKAGKSIDYQRRISVFFRFSDNYYQRFQSIYKLNKFLFPKGEAYKAQRAKTVLSKFFWTKDTERGVCNKKKFAVIGLADADTGHLKKTLRNIPLDNRGRK